MLALTYVVAGSLLTEVGGFLRVREKPQVRLPLSNEK